MIGSASDGLEENHPDEACGLASEMMLDACVTFDPKCKVDGEAGGKDNVIMVTKSNTGPPSGLRVMKIAGVDYCGWEGTLTPTCELLRRTSFVSSSHHLSSWHSCKDRTGSFSLDCMCFSGRLARTDRCRRLRSKGRCEHKTSTRPSRIASVHSVDPLRLSRLFVQMIMLEWRLKVQMSFHIVLFCCDIFGMS